MLNLDFKLMLLYSLSLEEYALLLLMQSKSFDLIREYFSNEAELYKKIDFLERRKFLILNKDGDKNCLGDYKVVFMPQYSSTIFDQWFEELLETYPKTVTRPDGLEDSLITNIPRSKDLYRRIIKVGGEELHKRILKSLAGQVELFTRTGKLKYFQKLPNWLANETWKEYETLITHGNTVKPNESYGQTLVQ